MGRSHGLACRLVLPGGRSVLGTMGAPALRFRALQRSRYLGNPDNSEHLTKASHITVPICIFSHFLYPELEKSNDILCLYNSLLWGDYKIRLPPFINGKPSLEVRKGPAG